MSFVTTLLFSFSTTVFAAPVPTKAPPPAPIVVSPDMRIAEDDLQGFKKGCVLGAEKDVPSAQTARYCDCMKSQVGETVDREEFRAYNQMVSASVKEAARISNEQFKAAEKKMSASVATCSAFLENADEKKQLQ